MFLAFLTSILSATALMGLLFGFKFLNSFEKKIDFLYLDSLDGQYEGASKHQLKEIQIAKNKLNRNSLVLLDDKGSKTNLSIDFMLNNNFKIINETKEQVLLSYL